MSEVIKISHLQFSANPSTYALDTEILFIDGV